MFRVPTAYLEVFAWTGGIALFKSRTLEIVEVAVGSFAVESFDTRPDAGMPRGTCRARRKKKGGKTKNSKRHQLTFSSKTFFNPSKNGPFGFSSILSSGSLPTSLLTNNDDEKWGFVQDRITDISENRKGKGKKEEEKKGSGGGRGKGDTRRKKGSQRPRIGGKDAG